MNEPLRRIRSFVVRGGRLTDAQRLAMERLAPRWSIDVPAGGTPCTLDLDAVFGRRAPRTLEIGFGNGEHLVHLAIANPARDHLGIEVHPPGVGRLLLACEAHACTNVRVACHDAVEVLERCLPDAAFDQVYLLFPDPWHKKRHHKRRLVQPAFVESIARVMSAGGHFRLATDWENYAEHMLATMAASSSFRNTQPAGGYAPRDTLRDPTRFERRGERLGHGNWDLVFERV